MEIVVVAEALADQKMACGLAIRVLNESGPAWVSDHPDALCSCRGIDKNTPLTKWSELRALGKERNVRVLGHPRDHLAGFDYTAARKAILLCGNQPDAFDALLLVRDMDRQGQQRRRSLNEAKADASFPVVLALPDPMRETWLLNGFVASDVEESERLAQETVKVGFDPCAQAERVASSESGNRRDPKRVLKALTKEGERADRCWEVTPLSVLAHRGEQTGLAAFLLDVKRVMIPLLTGTRN